MSSIYSQILVGVQASVATIVPNTYLRWKVQVLESDKANLPICVVAPGPTGEVLPIQTFKGGLVYEYPVFVAYIGPLNRAVSAGLTAWMDTREDIRNQLFQTHLSGVSPVFDTNFDPEEAVKMAGIDTTNYSVTGWIVRYKVAEERKA